MRVPTGFGPRRGKTAFGIYAKTALVNDAGKCARDKPVRLGSWADIEPDQAGGTLPRHETARPAVARIKILFITPEHL